MAVRISGTSYRGNSVFVYLNFDLWCMQPLIRGFRRLERGHGAWPDGLHLYGQMTPGWKGFREPDKKTMDVWVTACEGGGERKRGCANKGLEEGNLD